MTKFLSRFVALVGDISVLFVLLAMMGHFNFASARLTGTNPTGASADIFCVGPVGAEACIDSNGNVIPTTTLDTTLGTSSLVWNQAYINTMNVGSAGSTNSTGIGGTGASQATNSGLQVYGKVAVTGIVASTTVPVNSSYETVQSTSNTTVSITSTPSISTTTVVNGTTELPSGTFLIITSTGASGIILTDEGTLTGTRLQLGAATRTITQFKVLTLVYDAVDHFWREVSFANN